MSEIIRFIATNTAGAEVA